MRKQAQDITDYIEADTQAKFYDRYWNAGLYNDRVYALPFNTDTRMIFYNKTMFADAGVDAAAIKTWDDLLGAADKLDAKFNGQGTFRGDTGVQWQLFMAASLLVLLPSILIFFFMQKYIIQSVAVGGIKG